MEQKLFVLGRELYDSASKTLGYDVIMANDSAQAGLLWFLSLILLSETQAYYVICMYRINFE